MNERTPFGSRKVVARYAEPALAHLAKARLESEGIPAYIRDAHTIGIQWLYAVALGWIRVEVDEQNEETAIRILESKLDDDSVLEEWSKYPHPDRQCPHCGSDDLSMAPFEHAPLMRPVIKLLPFFKSHRIITCRSCSRTWKE